MADLHPRHLRPGFTLLEVLIAFVILVLFLGMIQPLFQYGKSTTRTVAKLDAYHDIRRIDHAVSGELRYSTGILYPPVRTASNDTWYPQMFFRDSINQVQALFLNKKGQLMLLNYDKLVGRRLGKGRIVGDHIASFLCRRSQDGLVEYQLKFEFEGNQRYKVSNRVNVLSLY